MMTCTGIAAETVGGKKRSREEGCLHGKAAMTAAAPMTSRTQGALGGRRAERKSPALAVETDSHRLAQRQKQIDFGKNTEGYDRYCKLLPRSQRRPDDPRTPDISRKISKRGFDGLIRNWRRKLHEWDAPVNEGDIDILAQIQEIKRRKMEEGDARDAALPEEERASGVMKGPPAAQGAVDHTPSRGSELAGIYSERGIDEGDDLAECGQDSRGVKSQILSSARAETSIIAPFEEDALSEFSEDDLL